MAKTIKMTVSDSVHAKLVAKANEIGMKRERFYQQVMEKASKAK